MLAESEILVDVRIRVPTLACWPYTGLYQGMRRHRRRQATRALTAKWKKLTKEFRYFEQVWRQVFFPEDDLVTQEEIIEKYGERIFVDPFENIHIAHVNANHQFLYSRGYLPGWYLDIIKRQRGGCEALPWPPKSHRKSCRWQLPPKGKKFRQAGGKLVDSVAAVHLFPEEWRPKDAYDVEDEEDQI